MKIEPVKIKIKDCERFGEVAFLVDREDFLVDLQIMRKTLNLDSLISYEDFEMFSNKNVDEGISYKIFSPKYMRDLVDYIAYSMQKKYKRPFYFDQIIKRAIICGEIREEDYQRVACELLYIGSESEEADWDRQDFLSRYDPSFALIFIPSRHAGKDIMDIKKAYKKCVQQLMTKYKVLLNYDIFDSYTNDKYLQTVEKLNMYTPDTISNIKRDRKWYWQNKNELTYLEIARTNPEKGVTYSDGYFPEDYEKVVERAVQRYKKHLRPDVYITK